MLAHARLIADNPSGTTGRQSARILRMRSQAPLILRPTRQQPPAALRHWRLNPDHSAGVSLVAGAAGPLGGDHFRLDIEVREGAVLIVRAVAATLVLPGPHGLESRSEINIKVASGGTLVWLPGRQILAERCRHEAGTRIDMDDGARLFAREELVLGRHGESPGAVRQRLRVSYDGVAIYDQELAVGDGMTGWDSSAVTGGRRALGSLLVVDAETEGQTNVVQSLPDGIPDTALMQLDAKTLLISSLAEDSIMLTRQLDAGLAQYARQQQAGHVQV